MYWILSFKPLEYIETDYNVFSKEDVSPFNLNTLYLRELDGSETKKICQGNEISKIVLDPSEIKIFLKNESESLLIETEMVPMNYTKKFEKSFRKAV